MRQTTLAVLALTTALITPLADAATLGEASKVEAAEPEAFFEAPEIARTRQFLSQIVVA